MIVILTNWTLAEMLERLTNPATPVLELLGPEFQGVTVGPNDTTAFYFTDATGLTESEARDRVEWV